MVSHSPPAPPAQLLVQEAARALLEAIALVAAGRAPDRRERHRRLVDQAITQAERAGAADDPRARDTALSILARAHAARAQDALHGAGQLSMSAQRAPTSEACDDGWQRVQSIVAVAEDSAGAAASAAHAFGPDPSPLASSARDAARAAAAAARAARTLVAERNHAYTFHTDHGFSFGEGWYLAAAALLAGAAIQVEPGRTATAQAERFLRDAGLRDRLERHRPRPRANKQTTGIVARAFRADPQGAQQKIRAAFLGNAPVARAVSDWIDPRLAGYGGRPKVLVWVRHGTHHPGRNTALSELVELTGRLHHAGLVPVLVGDALREGVAPAESVDLLLFWKDPIFRGEDGRRAQLQFFEHLRAAHGAVGQLGVTTAGMDGPALIGMPTIYLTETSNVRMRAWVGAVPGYREIVRESGYLERVVGEVGDWMVTKAASPTSSGGPR